MHTFIYMHIVDTSKIILYYSIHKNSIFLHFYLYDKTQLAGLKKHFVNFPLDNEIIYYKQNFIIISEIIMVNNFPQKHKHN